MSMLFAQLTHAIGLNDVCDALRLHSGPLSALRGATAPSRNNLSHANKRRDAALAERLFWTVLEHLQKLSPGFAAGRRGKGLARRFRRVIHVVDSSTIALIASCIDWAQHRRRKAAAKLHVRLDLHSLLPRFVLVESAKAADSIRAAEVCAGVKPGEIVIFDRAYVDFIHLGVLNGDGVFWVTRSKESLCQTAPSRPARNLVCLSGVMKTKLLEPVPQSKPRDTEPARGSELIASTRASWPVRKARAQAFRLIRHKLRPPHRVARERGFPLPTRRATAHFLRRVQR